MIAVHDSVPIYVGVGGDGVKLPIAVGLRSSFCMPQNYCLILPLGVAGVYNSLVEHLSIISKILISTVYYQGRGRILLEGN